MSAQKEGEESWTARFWRLACSSLPVWILLLTLESILLSVTIFSLVFGAPGTAPYLIARINLALIGVTAAGVVGIILYCRSRMSGA